MEEIGWVRNYISTGKGVFFVSNLEVEVTHKDVEYFLFLRFVFISVLLT